MGFSLRVDQCLNFCCEMARQLNQNGAEMYRVEESARRILDSYGYDAHEVFAIPSCILITIQWEGRNYTKSVRILRSTNNLDKLEKLNSLSRRVCLTKLPLDEAEQELLAILAAPDYPWPISYLGHGCAALFFSLLFGGTLADACVAFLSGLLVKRTVTGLTKRGVNAFFINLVASLFMVAVPVLLRFAGLPVQPDKVIIGAIMLLVPGVAITNVMRDVIAGDFLTAISKLAEVLIVALAIAIGIALAYVLTGALLGGAA